MKRAAVIGSPVAHSKSPLIHGAWLKQYGIHGGYTRVEVQPDALPAFLDRIRGGEFVGCNVTMPLKAHIARHVDEVLPAARVLGSVNTVWRGDAGRLIATSTDGEGFVGHLDLAAPGWRDGDGGVLVLGAGGAARAIVDALLRTGAGDIAVTNRTVARADELAALFAGKVAVKDWVGRGSNLGATSLLINTTSLGMTGQPPLEMPLDGLAGNAIVADIVYAPLKTNLLAEAEARGLQAVDGLGMLLHQAVPGFERFFGVRPQVHDELRDIVLGAGS